MEEEDKTESRHQQRASSYLHPANPTEAKVGLEWGTVVRNCCAPSKIRESGTTDLENAKRRPSMGGGNSSAGPTQAKDGLEWGTVVRNCCVK